MAKFRITEVVTLGMDDEFTGTDWQISRNEDFTDLVVDIQRDMVNKYYLHIALRDPVTNRLIEPYDGVYARARQWFGETPTEWHYAESCYSDGNLNNDGEAV